jgi:hypothetical protein
MMFTLVVIATLVGKIPDGLENSARRFLDAYGRGDEAQVMSMVTAGDFHAYGSDAAEAIEGREAFRSMLADDQKLWGGKASIGPMTHVSAIQSGKLATLFFDAEFSLSGRTVPIRFATVWRKEHGAWRLAQESNVVPTTGQSAGEILKKTKP